MITAAVATADAHSPADLEIFTVSSTPSLGIAITSTATRYMGHADSALPDR
jgi:hypothetical protein